MTVVPSAYLSDTDAIAAAVAQLSTHPAMTDALGGEGRVRATNEPPYPRIRVVPGVGSDGALLWVVEPAVTIEALGDLDGSTSPTALRRILYIALGCLKEMTEKSYGYGEPVVTNVRSTGAGGYSPLPTGQPRWLATVAIAIHPGVPAPTP